MFKFFQKIINLKITIKVDFFTLILTNLLWISGLLIFIKGRDASLVITNAKNPALSRFYIR